MKNILKNQIKEFCKSTELCARVEDIKFDIETLKNDVLEIVKTNDLISKDKQSSYKALGLQYRKEQDQYFDSVKTIRYIDENHKSIIETYPARLWNIWNDVGEKLKYVYKPIYELDIELYRTRLLLADGDYASLKHIDYDWRYHVPIMTNKECFLEYENEKIHLPADGHAYIVNAGFMHSFCNGGSTPRYHYCGILSLSNRGDGLKPPQLYD